MKWSCFPFAELPPKLLYDAMVLRQKVFVMEQQCLFRDADGHDVFSHHLFGYDNNDVLAAYARLVPAGVVYQQASIGRVVTADTHRKIGLGKCLFEQALNHAFLLWGEGVPLKIQAQFYLHNFYSSFGFVATGEPYLEDDILHINMIKNKINIY